MMPLDTRQWNLPPQACFEDTTARFHPGVALPDAAELHDARCLQPPPPPFKSLLWSHDKEFCGKRFSLSDMRSWCAAAAAATHGGALDSAQKGLMILDQSGNKTRLLQCVVPSPAAAAEPVKCVNGKESEMHEDTEEINALLYSDEDCESDDDDDDDEVMSTGHSPYSVEQVCNKRQLEEIDGPCKRQRLLDKVENISGSSSSSLVVGSSTKEDTGSGLRNEQSRKDKILTALKILESIVPGAKGNQALLLLDEAIDYLKLLKQELISTSH